MKIEFRKKRKGKR